MFLQRVVNILERFLKFVESREHFWWFWTFFEARSHFSVLLRRVVNIFNGFVNVFWSTFLRRVVNVSFSKHSLFYIKTCCGHGLHWTARCTYSHSPWPLNQHMWISRRGTCFWGSRSCMCNKCEKCEKEGKAYTLQWKSSRMWARFWTAQNAKIWWFLSRQPLKTIP